jgi:hypothetical protein
MKPQKAKLALKTNFILWNEAIGFSLMIALSWLTELLHIPHLIFGEPFTPNWHRAIIRTIIIVLIWGWVHWITRRLLKRLHHLEEFLRVCSWCRRVCDQDQWLTMEEYFSSKFATHTTHGMCPDCMNKEFDDGEKKENPRAAPKP